MAPGVLDDSCVAGEIQIGFQGTRHLVTIHQSSTAGKGSRVSSCVMLAVEALEECRYAGLRTLELIAQKTGITNK